MKANHTTVVPSGETDPTPYGRRLDLLNGGPGVIDTAGPDFNDRYTREALIDGSGHLGLTVGPGLPADVHRMERHRHTSEAVCCLAGPVILPVAAPGDERPRTSDVRALLITPGECVILNPGVWHAPCCGVDGPAAYYWFAAVDETRPTDWVELDDGPVRIELDETRPA